MKKTKTPTDKGPNPTPAQKLAQALHDYALSHGAESVMVAVVMSSGEEDASHCATGTRGSVAYMLTLLQARVFTGFVAEKAIDAMIRQKGRGK